MKTFRIVLTSVLLVMACLIGAAPIPATAQPALTIRASSDGVIQYTRSVVISGAASSSAAGQEIDLQGDTFPFGGFATVGTAQAGSDGSFSFRESPTHNTKYRVVLASDTTQRSKVITVHVLCDFIDSRSVFVSTGRVRASFTLRCPTDIKPAGLPLYWYLGINHPPRYARAGTSPMPQPTSPGVTKVTHTFEVPAVFSHWNWAVLFPDLPKQGMGLTTCRGPKEDPWPLGNPTCKPPASVPA